MSNRPGTPSTIMSLHLARQMQVNAGFPEGYGLPFLRSPRSVMANAEDEDPNEEQQDKQELQNQMTKAFAVRFSSADKELLESGKYADAKIIANGKTYDVHKNVLCTRSKWFRKVLEGAFREGQESIVEISAPDNIERVLEFLYTGTVNLSNTDLMMAANELSTLGDFYLIEEMSDYAVQILGSYLGEYLNAICDIKHLPTVPAEYATKHYWNSLKRSTTPRREHNFVFLLGAGFIDRLCVAIRDAYATPSGIHRVYVDFVYAARIHTFKNPLIRALRDEIPEFGYDLLTALMTGAQSSAFRGNETFQQWEDGLANPEAVAAAERWNAQGDRSRITNNRRRDWEASSPELRGPLGGWGYSD